ncbi:MAG: hypothetical protein RJA22_1927 [Verrucomicrobiota bacterium]|jgi:SAM-dependent methyltransferase
MPEKPSLLRRARTALRPVRRFARECRHRLWRSLRLIGQDWAKGLPEELLFWEKALQDPARHWVESEFRERTNPTLELQDAFKALIDAPPGAVVRLLDVGAGPLTRLGKHWEGRRVEIVPVDPLADEYAAMMQRIGLQPPVLTRRGDGEKLLEQFAENSFDLAYASNSLDHSYDPLGAIRQMFAVVKPGCWVYLWHFAHVGVTEGYAGLHQWDFDLKDGDVILSDGRGRSHSLAAEFRGVGRLVAESERFLGEPVVVARIQKKPVA